MAPAEDFSKVKAAITENVVVQEEEIQAKQKSPITILSDDEGYLLEEDQSIAKTKVNIDSGKEFSTLESKTVRLRKKKDRIEAMEFCIVKHQGRTLKMLGELAPGWRPKTKPKNKLRLNMKKLLDPRLNTKEMTVLDDISSDEKPEIDKMSIKKEEKNSCKNFIFSSCKGKKVITVSRRFKYHRA